MHAQPARQVEPSPRPAPGAAFRADVLAGLGAARKTIPCKYLYDARGSELFEAICDQPEYYPTRTELAILLEHAADIAHALGPSALVLEYGAGAGVKTRVLLDALREPAAYVPIDISTTMLEQTARRLAARFPDLEVRPVCADYAAPLDLPTPDQHVQRRLAFFPGSTIGNLEPDDAAAFLRQIADHVGPGGALLIGVDLRKPAAVLERAYDDRAGVTAAFNGNLLHRLRRELGARLAPDRFRHRALYDPDRGRVEMHLESTADQTIRIDDHAFALAPGETIHTENSYKYTRDGFTDLARAAGWRPQRTWTDRDALFSVHLLHAGDRGATARHPTARPRTA